MLLGVALTVTLPSCRTAIPTEFEPRSVVSLFGGTLAPPPMTDERRAELEANTAEALARLEALPDEEGFIWYGRRLAYEFRYHDAITVFSAGLERFPDSFKLRRHRGHRFITVRDFERAVDDLAQAAELATDVPDAIEPDGAPNRFGIPTSTNQSNIYYHLGLAHYLLGQFDEALAAYEQGLSFARVNNDLHVAMAWWTYLAQRRTGRDTSDVLAPIRADMELLENHAYHQLLLLAAGERQAEALLSEAEEGIAGATLRGGIANDFMARGEIERATAMYRRLVAGPDWMAFGHITAEAELRRIVSRY